MNDSELLDRSEITEKSKEGEKLEKPEVYLHYCDI
jgi:hypothetical protein